MNFKKICFKLSCCALLAASQLASADLSGKVHFETALTNVETVPFVDKPEFSGFAKARLVYSSSGWALKYYIMTNMDANAGWATTPDLSDDITKIHLHENPPGIAGPHVLNVFKAPAQDDDDLKVESTMGNFSGQWDSNDTNDDGLAEGPATEPFDDDFLATLCDDDIYVNIHGSDELGVPDTGALRGNLMPIKWGERLCRKLLD